MVGIEIERGVEVEVPQNVHKKDLPNHLQVAVVMQVAVMPLAVAVAEAGSLLY